MNIKQPIYVEYNLDALVGDSKPIRITHIEDNKVDVLELCVRHGGQKIDLTGATVTARIVLHGKKDILLNDNVSCTVSNGNALIPFDNAVLKSYKGIWKIEVNIKRNTEVLTLPHPLWVMVNDTILATAEVLPESEGTIPELLKKVEEELKRVQGYVDMDTLFDTLDNTLSGDSSLAPALFVKSKGDNYALVYVDSKDEEHELFDFAALPAARGEKGDKGDSVTHVEIRSDGVLYITIESADQTARVFPVGTVVGAKGADGKNGNGYDNAEINQDGDLIVREVLGTGASREVNLGHVVGAQGVPGDDGFSPSATVQQTASGATVTITDKNGTTTADISNGADGKDYVLTAQDKTDIADIVLSELPTTQGVLYGNTSN